MSDSDFKKWCEKNRPGMPGNNGKVDKARPTSDAFRDNYDEIFKKEEKNKKPQKKYSNKIKNSGR